MMNYLSGGADYTTDGSVVWILSESCGTLATLSDSEYFLSWRCTQGAQSSWMKRGISRAAKWTSQSAKQGTSHKWEWRKGTRGPHTGREPPKTLLYREKNRFRSNDVNKWTFFGRQNILGSFIISQFLLREEFYKSRKYLKWKSACARWGAGRNEAAQRGKPIKHRTWFPLKPEAEATSVSGCFSAGPSRFVTAAGSPRNTPVLGGKEQGSSSVTH